MNSRKISLITIIAGTIMFFTRYWDAIFQYKIIGNANDSVHLIGPVFKKINSLMYSGQDPYWVEELVGGIPFFNNAMFSYTYPFYFLGVIDYGDGIEVLRTVSLIIIFHMGLLFLSNWILLRVIGFGKIESLISAFGVILCLNTAYNSPWIIAIGGYALIPLFFAGIISLFKEKSALSGILMLALGSLCFLAKPAQTAILAIVFGGILTLCGFWVFRNKMKFLLPRFIIAGLLVLGINLPGLVQLYIDFPEMIRFTAGAGAVKGNTIIPLEAFKSQVDFSETLDYLIYQTKNIGVGHPWAGPFSIFALFAFWFIPKPLNNHRWIPITFFWITLVTIIIAFGKELPTFWIHYKMPLLNKIRESSRFLFITNIGFTVLLAYLLSSIKQYWTSTSTLRLATGLLAFSTIILSYQCFLDLKSITLALILLCLGAVTSIAVYRNKSYFGFLAISSVILVIYALLLPNLRFGKNKVSGYNNPTNLGIHNTLSQIPKNIEDYNDFRTMYHVDDVRDGEFSNAGLYYNIRSFQGTTVVIPANQYEDLWHSEKFMNYRLFWGAKYHLYASDSIPESNLQNLVLETKHYNLYSHEKALPRAYFASKVLKFDGDARKFRNKLSKQKWPSPFAYLPSDTFDENKLYQNYPKNIGSTVESINYYNNILTINVNQKKAAFLSINEYYSPHWTATIDGKESKIFKANVNQMGVISPSGNHIIKLQYKPKLFNIFWHIQKICFLLLIVLLCIISLQSYRSRAEYPTP